MSGTKKQKQKPAETMEEIRRRNKAADHRWFDADTRRFFRSRVGSAVFVRADGSSSLFVSSEQGPGIPRRWSVREALPGGEVQTCPGTEFQQFASAAEARRAAKRIAEGKG